MSDLHSEFEITSITVQTSEATTKEIPAIQSADIDGSRLTLFAQETQVGVIAYVYPAIRTIVDEANKFVMDPDNQVNVKAELRRLDDEVLKERLLEAIFGSGDESFEFDEKADGGEGGDGDALDDLVLEGILTDNGDVYEQAFEAVVDGLSEIIIDESLDSITPAGFVLEYDGEEVFVRDVKGRYLGSNQTLIESSPELISAAFIAQRPTASVVTLRRKA